MAYSVRSISPEWDAIPDSASVSSSMVVVSGDPEKNVRKEVDLLVESARLEDSMIVVPTTTPDTSNSLSFEQNIVVVDEVIETSANEAMIVNAVYIVPDQDLVYESLKSPTSDPYYIEKKYQIKEFMIPYFLSRVALGGLRKIFVGNIYDVAILDALKELIARNRQIHIIFCGIRSDSHPKLLQLFEIKKVYKIVEVWHYCVLDLITTMKLMPKMEAFMIFSMFCGERARYQREMEDYQEAFRVAAVGKVAVIHKIKNVSAIERYEHEVLAMSCSNILSILESINRSFWRLFEN